MKKQLIGLGVVILMFGCGNAGAAPMQWTLASGGNGHWYDYVADLSTWDQANNNVQGMQYEGLDGHLATLTSAAENTFVWDSLSPSFTHQYNAWLGGYQVSTPNEPAESPSSDWAWVTGEEWSYVNWNSGEPNDGASSESAQEDHIHFRFNGNWNDLYNTSQTGGYVVEYEATPTPEPATMLLFGTGLVGLVGSRIRKKK